MSRCERGRILHEHLTLCRETYEKISSRRDRKWQIFYCSFFLSISRAMANEEIIIKAADRIIKETKKSANSRKYSINTIICDNEFDLSPQSGIFLFRE